MGDHTEVCPSPPAGVGAAAAAGFDSAAGAAAAGAGAAGGAAALSPALDSPLDSWKDNSWELLLVSYYWDALTSHGRNLFWVQLVKREFNV